MMKLHKTGNLSETGFTIIELMIATLVFAVVLVVIAAGVLAFTHDYYRGLNSSTTQNTARSIVDTITEAVQYGPGTPAAMTAPNQRYFCAGNNEYYIDLGNNYQDSLGVTTTNYGLYAVPIAGGCQTGGSVPTTGGKELLGNNMRISYFDFEQTSTPLLYTIHLRIAYSTSGGSTNGNDLLCAPASGPAGNCAASFHTLTNANLSAADVTCKSNTGSQFCAISDLSSSIAERVDN